MPDQRQQLFLARCVQPSQGKRQSEKHTWIGISIAETTPPALKSIHKKGSFDLLPLPLAKDPSHGGGYHHQAT